MELPDPLLRRVKAYARERGSPLREVFAAALEMFLRERSTAPGEFRLQSTVTKGAGLQIDGDWSETRSLIYEGHGG